MNVVIIGNGSSVFSNKNGNKIDTFDYVVRMGTCIIEGYERYVGTKTDLLRTSWDRIIKKDSTFVFNNKTVSCKNLLFLEPDFDPYVETIPCAGMYKFRKIFSKKRFYEFRFGSVISNANERIVHDSFIDQFLQGYNIEYYKQIDREQLFIHYNNTVPDGILHLPSGGLCTIDYVVKRFHGCNIFITGFDSFKTKYYWRNNDEYFDTHCAVKEAIYLKRLLKRGVISLL